jgi:hypothetical protein
MQRREALTYNTSTTTNNNEQDWLCYLCVFLIPVPKPTANSQCLFSSGGSNFPG